MEDGADMMKLIRNACFGCSNVLLPSWDFFTLSACSKRSVSAPRLMLPMYVFSKRQLNEDRDARSGAKRFRRKRHRKHLLVVGT
jgi:hypothetical protein